MKNGRAVLVDALCQELTVQHTTEFAEDRDSNGG